MPRMIYVPLVSSSRALLCESDFEYQYNFKFYLFHELHKVKKHLIYRNAENEITL